MSPRSEEIEAMIADAFNGVRLGSGVSLHETLVIDQHGTDAQRARARAVDEHNDWFKLINLPALKELAWIGGLSFYDAEGLRFHLPAYLTLAVRNFECEEAGNVLEILMSHLTLISDYNQERFSILSDQQRLCVHDVLVYLRETYELESDELDQAIVGYWGT